MIQEMENRHGIEEKAGNRHERYSACRDADS